MGNHVIPMRYLLLFHRYYVILFCEKQAIRLKSTSENVLLVQGVFCLIISEAFWRYFIYVSP